MTNTWKNKVGSSSLVFVGDQSLGGTYVLRIRVRNGFTIAFGRFKKGKAIHLEAGDYLYVGSALALKGATCLARRLVRHATRTGAQPPHPIRAAMQTEFKRLGLGCDDLLPKNGKTLRWNVDHLLDQPDAELVAVIAIRSPLRLEGELGKLLASDPATVIFEPGLGANDIKGSTHLLRVEGGNEWWQRLPGRLRTFRKQRVVLANMHSCRRQAIERHMQAGMSYSAAVTATLGVFDTVGWHEVQGRLSRARGIVCGIANKLSEGSVDEMDSAFQEAVRRLATQIASAAASLLQHVDSAAPGALESSPVDPEPSTKPYALLGRIKRAFAIGQLRAAHKLVAKCLRDAPLIEVRGGTALTSKQRADIDREIRRIQRGARQLKRGICGA